MFRALKQFAVVVIFLLLAVFSALYFQEDREGAAEQTKNETSSWLINSVKNVGQLFSSVADFSLTVQPEVNFSENDQFTSWEEVADYDFNNSEVFTEGRVLVTGLNQTAEKSEFSQFFNDFFKEMPARYLDAKIYSNAWRNFKSVGWLREKQ